MKRKAGDRYHFDMNNVDKPVERELEIFNKHKYLVKYVLRGIKCRDDQRDDLISAGYMGLLKKIRYNDYHKDDGIEKYKKYYMQWVKQAMLYELKKMNPKHNAKIIPFSDDINSCIDNVGNCKVLTGTTVNNDDAAFCVRWHDDGTHKSKVSEIRPAIRGNPESICGQRNKLANILAIMAGLDCVTKREILDKFGLVTRLELTFDEMQDKYDIPKSSIQHRIATGLKKIKTEYIRKFGNEI